MQFIWAAIMTVLTALGGAVASHGQDSVAGGTHWQSATEMAEFFTRRGFQIETGAGNSLWLTAANGTQVRMSPLMDRDQTCCSGVRLEALWLIGDSEAAEQVALEYERSNFLATLTIADSEPGMIIHLQRDILMVRHRSPANVIANTGLLFQLIPHFQSALVDADPALTDYWAGLRETGR